MQIIQISSRNNISIFDDFYFKCQCCVKNSYIYFIISYRLVLCLFQKFLKGNETLQLTAKVDPNLIGGMIVSIGDKYVDMSVASKVKKYTELISAAV